MTQKNSLPVVAEQDTKCWQCGETAEYADKYGIGLCRQHAIEAYHVAGVGVEEL